MNPIFIKLGFLLFLWIIWIPGGYGQTAESTEEASLQSNSQKESISEINVSASQTDEPSEQAERPPVKSFEERTLEARGVIKENEPKFVTEGSSLRSQGMYFGVGFRQFHLNLRGGTTAVSNDAALNGIAFNLGYFTEAWTFEYSRHVSLITLENDLKRKNDFFNVIEVIQNNLWYFLSTRVSKDLYFHYGLGLQSSEIQLICRNSSNCKRKTNEEGMEVEEENTKLSREGSALLGLGASYFITPDFMVQYRVSQGSYAPSLTGRDVNNVLHSSQFHAIYLEYYFAL